MRAPAEHDHAPPAPLFVALYDGPPATALPRSTSRIGGVFVHPAETVLALPGFEDAYEGLTRLGEDEQSGATNGAEDGAAYPIPWTLFDLEKIVRMMLHQSGLAFAILTAAPTLHTTDDFDPRAIAGALATRDLLAHYRDLGRDALGTPDPGAPGEVASLLDALRYLCAGVALAERGAVAHSMATLLAHAGRLDLPDGLDELVAPTLEGARLDRASLEALGAIARDLSRRLERALAGEGGALPGRPHDYDGVSEMLVTRRLDAHR
jgi:hypothetical protein